MWDFSTLKFKAERGFLSRSIAPTFEFKASQEKLRQRKVYEAPAIALWWDAHRVMIFCPYCHKTHSHGVGFFAEDDSIGGVIQDPSGRFKYNGPSPDRCLSRRAHCNYDINNDVDYTILFPFESDGRVDGLSFQIETISKRNENGELDEHQRFRTLGLDVSELPMSETDNHKETEEQRDMRNKIRQLSLEGADFVRTFDLGDGETMERPASKSLVQYALCGKLKGIQSILEAVPGSRQLLRIAHSEDGKSLLHLAVPNGHHEVVKFLLKEGVDINALDDKGRTPLMEGALWSCVDIVDTLVSAGADIKIRDWQGREAADFTEESERNDEERHKRHFKYNEDPFVKKRHRRLIRARIESRLPKRTQVKIGLEDLTDAYFYKSSIAGSISFVIPTQGIRITSLQKTAAFLNRGPPFPVMAAVSGWTGVGTEEFREPEAGFERLDAAYWQNEVFKIASELDFIFRPHRFDHPSKPGSFNASHAEPQLMSYFIRKNYIFRDYNEGDTVVDDFLQLFMLQPRRKDAQIIVSKEPCESCEAFGERIRTNLGITFNFRTLKVRDD